MLALIDSRDPKQYIQRMKQRDPQLGKGWLQFVQSPSRRTNTPPTLATRWVLTPGGNWKKKTGRKVVTSDNYLALTQSVKKAKSLAKPAPHGKPSKP